MKLHTAWVVIALIASSAAATEIIPFNSPRWQIEAAEHEIEEYLGKQSLRLKGGLAVISDAEFTDGVIEYLCSFPDARAFVGASWRIQDAANREEFYIRSHQAGNPDANQYTPIFNGLSAWQLYHGEGFGAPVDYAFDTWIPVKIVVSGDQAEVYIGDLETPALFIDDLKREAAEGGVGLNVANFGAAHFAEFSYQAVDGPELKGRVERERTRPEGSVAKWNISDSFAEAAIHEILEIPAKIKDERKWTVLETESTGLANLSRVNPLSREADTVFARVTVRSDKAQSKVLAVGYSDRLRLFLNGRLFYIGNNGYRTRDYRYLGTIGFFDAITLPLEKGDNELWLAVSESFGGWGVQAAFESPDGLTMEE